MQSARWDRHFEKPLRFHWRLSQGGEKPNASRALNQSSPETGLPDSNPSLSLTDLFPHRYALTSTAGLSAGSKLQASSPVLLRSHGRRRSDSNIRLNPQRAARTHVRVHELERPGAVGLYRRRIAQRC
jgi:hypothetical protein